MKLKLIDPKTRALQLTETLNLILWWSKALFMGFIQGLCETEWGYLGNRCNGFGTQATSEVLI